MSNNGVEVGKQYTLDMEGYSAWYFADTRQSSGFLPGDVLVVDAIEQKHEVEYAIVYTPIYARIPTAFLIPVEEIAG